MHTRDDAFVPGYCALCRNSRGFIADFITPGGQSNYSDQIAERETFPEGQKDFFRKKYLFFSFVETHENVENRANDNRIIQSSAGKRLTPTRHFEWYLIHD